MKPVKSAVFLDRDGVIIVNRSDYVKTPEEVLFLPKVFEALHTINQSSYAIVLITNQSVVGRGIITLDQALRINQGVIAEIIARGGRIDASYICPHRPDEKCSCRKPAPGLLLKAAEELQMDLTRSYLIGDAVSDIEAASLVGAQGILVLTGRGREQANIMESKGNSAFRAVAIMPDLEKAVDFIIAQTILHSGESQ